MTPSRIMQSSTSISELLEAIEIGGTVGKVGSKVNLTPLRQLRRRFPANFQERVQQRKCGSILASACEVIVNYRNQVIGIPDFLYQIIAVTFKIIQIKPHGGPQRERLLCPNQKCVRIKNCWLQNFAVWKDAPRKRSYSSLFDAHPQLLPSVVHSIQIHVRVACHHSSEPVCLVWTDKAFDICFLIDPSSIPTPSESRMVT
mmetsp:Transcript_23692/g.43518  ORF Transcript_23692/g.43518 Transcript_23692/m.43518 type:complete len:201 (-) Transcript_23692:153-755(-)